MRCRARTWACWWCCSTVILLTVTLFSVALDARSARLAGSLELANAELQAVNEELRQRAFIDPLTRLCNRPLFEDRLQHALLLFERNLEHAGAIGPPKVAVLFVDLDGFKPVNDTLGHAAGDTLLKEVAARLRTAARSSDTVARIGGDEFVVLMEGVVGVSDCAALARRVLEALGRSFEIAGRQVTISGSVGVAIHPDNGHRDKLLAHADAAMYAAKEPGGNTFALFEPHMEAAAHDQLSLQNDLRRAIELGQLQLHYQPKVDARRGQIRGVEALVRWDHPERGFIGPAVFIPVAERFGLITAIGNWVIDEACRQLEEWADEGVRMRVAVNFSVHQLRDKNLVGRIGTALERHHVEPSQFMCEITESIAMEDVRTTRSSFEELAKIGVFLAIDDFGTGYSSLSYLRQLPARQLKIDRSFIDDIEESADARAIVGAIIQVARSLNLTVVAEGVETEGQRDLLIDMGCDELQGYLYARPMSAGSLLAWITGRERAGPVEFSPSVWHGDLSA